MSGEGGDERDRAGRAPDPDDARRGLVSGEHDVTTREAVTGWSRTEPEERRRRERGDQTGRTKRKRITLDVAGPPLALPSMTPNADVPLPTIDPPSAELALPDLERLVLGRSSMIGESPRHSSTPLPFALDDGWGRSRDVPSSAPPRPRASTPPPFNVAMAQGMKLPEAVIPKGRPPGSSVLDLEGEMMDRYALGDFSGALLAAELVLGKQADHDEAKRCAESCRERLCHLHLSRLGGGTRVPRVAVAGSEVRWLGLDHRAGFLLSRVDGASSIEELVDLSGMPRHEALKLLVELMEAGALKF